jgi:hypothetical protein
LDSEEWGIPGPLHIQKCAIVKFDPVGNGDDNNSKVYLNGTELNTSKCERDLGVFVDSKVSPDTHCTNVINKARKIIFTIRRTFKYLDKCTQC